MNRRDTLKAIRENLFYGVTEYTKNQPDIYIPNAFQLLAPSQTVEFLEEINAAVDSSEVLVYVHFPFCFSECIFCNSFPHRTDIQLQEKYLDCVLSEIQIFADAGLFSGKTARGIYFGGGTPTAFSNQQLERVIRKLEELIPIHKDASITCEAHPATLVAPGRIEELGKLKINRVSIGCQSFDPEVLKLCRRRNSENQLSEIVKKTRNCGIASNIDMMTGLPGQHLASIEHDLEVLSRIQPDAIEYIRHEIVNPQMADLYRNQPDLIIEDNELFEIIYRTQQWMDRHGYEQNGRFSSGRQWEYRYHWLHEMPILAFGARTRSYTHSMFYDKHEELSSYIMAGERGIPPIIRFFRLNKEHRMSRSLFLKLQLKRGLNRKCFTDRFGIDAMEHFRKMLELLQAWGCLEIDEQAIRLSRQGSYYVEDICDFIMDSILSRETGSPAREPHSSGQKSTRLKTPRGRVSYLGAECADANGEVRKDQNPRK